jgi:DNA-binding MarR family transcriptional regulator
MSTTLHEDIQRSGPFESAAEEATLNLARAAAVMARETGELFREHGLSEPQYNVLRILRGAGAEGRTCGEIGDRMITRDPDVTRLLDRLERAGLVERERSAADRRVVITRITSEGLRLTDALDGPITARISRRLGGLSEREQRELSRLLVKIWSEGE